MNHLFDFPRDPLFLALIGFIVLMLVFTILQKLRRSLSWRRMAARLGLQFSRVNTSAYHEQRLSGLYRQRSLTISETVSARYRAIQRRYTDDRQKTETEIRLKVNLPPGYRISIARAVTIGEATPLTGNAEIDRHFSISSEPAWLALKALTSLNVRQNLLRLKLGGRIFIQEIPQETYLVFSKLGRIADEGYLRFLMDFLSDLADSMEAANASGS